MLRPNPFLSPEGLFGGSAKPAHRAVRSPLRRGRSHAKKVLATIDPRSMTGRHALFADTALPSAGVVQVHTPAMDVDFDFSWSQFLWSVFIFVGVPTTIGAGIIRSALRSEQAGLHHTPGRDSSAETYTGSGRLGLWATSLIAFPLGFLSCMGWLSWSADYNGEFRGPGLPAPNQFPTWQVIACGITTVLVCLAAAHLSRWATAGGLAAAAGTAAGFTTAFSVNASADVTGQAGVGVVLSEIGWGLALGVLMLARGAWLANRRSRLAARSQQ